MKKFVAIKETYEKVSDEEYNRINPYDKFRTIIKGNHPDAKIIKTETVIEPFGRYLVPVMAMYYEIPKPCTHEKIN